MKRLFALFSILTFISTASFAQNSAETTPPVPIYDTPITPPAFTWQDEYGQTVSLDNFKGDVIFLNFWATWCAPCAYEMPAFNFLQNRYGAGDFKIVAINVGKEPLEKVNAFLQKNNLDALSLYMNPENNLTSLFGTNTLPTTYIINRQGQIIAGKAGLASWMSPDMMSFIEQLMKEENPYAVPFILNQRIEDISTDLQPTIRY